MYSTNKRFIAGAFLLILSLQTFCPGVAYALTSGPTQPEMAKFQPAGASDMVDLFTGDFKYNIPLMDVGGYPLNLSYQSGAGIEDEASWVGAGWVMNPGSISRSVRGLPDDFSGDKVEKYYTRKAFKKVSAELVVKPSVLAWEYGKIGFKSSVYKDNYDGIGASVGISIDGKSSRDGSTALTAGLELDINSDVRDGLDIAPTFSLSRAKDDLEGHHSRGLSGGFKYNNRDGLKYTTLGTTYSDVAYGTSKPDNKELSFVNYFGQTYTPIIPVNTISYLVKRSVDLGPSFFGGYVGIGGTGYYYTEKVENPLTASSAYGYMYHLSGRKKLDALIDFNRENEATFIQSAPAIPIPVSTHDFFMATGQAGSRQFRAHFAGNYVTFDKLSKTTSAEISDGMTAGWGNLFKVGGRISLQGARAATQKWTTDNYFLENAEKNLTLPHDEPVYFKQVGECTKMEESLYDSLGRDNTYRILGSDKALSKIFVGKNREYVPTRFMKRTTGVRDLRTDVVSYLTAEQAALNGFDKKISFYNKAGEKYDSSRVSDYRKPHHISEISVTDKDGKRIIYGIPVYNTQQRECTFSVPPPADMDQARRTGLITYNTDGTAADNPVHKYGRDEMSSREITPAYTTGFLLTEILSPDYVDKKEDGITDDDAGNAYKFSYTKLDNKYYWRTPTGTPAAGAKYANYNEGFISDASDDKASFVYGEREVWYNKSIESKNMIAIFATSDREDALGVGGVHMNASSRMKLQKLDSIKLYFKSEYLKDPVNAKPIKTVHFEYDYSICPNMPNNSGIDLTNGSGVNANLLKGKLTLKRVYFTFGNNKRGQTNPYEFEYDMRSLHDGSIPGVTLLVEGNDYRYEGGYANRSTDRWGTYKRDYYNPQANTNRLSTLYNAEYPYTPQENDNTDLDEVTVANRLASKWQLNKIVTPPGTVINITYEADDYAYVQNRRAMQMCRIKELQKDGAPSGLIGANQIVVELPKALPDVTPEAFLKTYLQGQSNIFFKAFVDLDNRGHAEYVHGYAELDLTKCSVINSTSARIGLKMIDGVSPLTNAAWQMLRTDLKKYAYDNYSNTDIGDIEAAIRAMIQAQINFIKAFQSFNGLAKNRKFGDKINFFKSFVRLQNPDGKKKGGGARVKQIMISDEWNAMSLNQKKATYGQEYVYTTLNKDGATISSGVASYEPAIGNEENPFHEPLNYAEKVYWTNDRYHYIEKPFCESFFPAPQVGYSKVKVIDFGVDNEQSSGYAVHEFYTAKDFPTLVDYTSLAQRAYENSMIIQLFTSISVKRVQTSQGFKVDLNDMHGKPRSATIYNKNGEKIASTEYFYNVKDENAELKELDNTVSVLNENGGIEEKILATDMDIATDLRDSDSEKIGFGIAPYAGALSAAFFPLPYGSYRMTPSRSANTYRSASMVKVIHRYGLVKRVRTMQHGSYTEAENMLWDGQTGQVVLTKNQNEFNYNTYAFTYPAWMIKDYETMGGAYKNLGIVLRDLSSDPSGIIQNYLSFLNPGDELGDMSGSATSQRAWVIKDDEGKYRLIDKNGEWIRANNVTYIILRSGKRNMLNASAGTVVCMNNPIFNGTLNLGVDRRILEAKMLEYGQVWGAPIKNKYEPYNGTARSSWGGCVDPVNRVINPYYEGILGNWRPKADYVYVTNRVHRQSQSTLAGSTDIRNSGFYQDYSLFWLRETTGALNKFIKNPDLAASKWVANNTSIYYDQKGNEIESKDPLNRYGAVLYGYQQSAAIAIAANARHNEIAFDGFEDYNYSSGVIDTCPMQKHFDWELSNVNGNCSSSVCLSGLRAHTGKYSLQLNGGFGITKAQGSGVEPNAIFSLLGGKYTLTNNELAKGFGTVPQKEYLLSMWVYDGQPASGLLTKLSISVNGEPYANQSLLPVVEGWKKVDIRFTAENQFSLALNSSGTVYIDDFRIQPVDGQISTYAYDARNMRLMAQLDENNYATFYEYDDEGTPIRVKKETERGIVTLKETRQFLKTR
ncbi:hypothetical protein [Filimonas effusa]|uniref:RHS repeat-associated core domain-containing protein n=1 Tax=Filimonas effusa TaxID=2508721 RepID=A0A4V1MAB2_9BACT|nr:hypothetical protein [Filimonas effusa]RXK85266.1 hypothetical protein ESB13_00095 [Filimonas effusa]